MGDVDREAAEELAALARLAGVYSNWHTGRPLTTPSKNPDMKAVVEKLRLIQATRQPPDVERLIQSREDPLRALLLAELAGLGWRLYARGGCDLMSGVYLRLERDRHPSFVTALEGAWSGIGFADDSRGVWDPVGLL